MVRVTPVAGESARASFKLLEEALRAGEPLPEPSVARFQQALQSGEAELLAASEDEVIVGVLLLFYRFSISAGRDFGSVEELYVKPGARRRGVGKALIETAGARCATRGVSYVEAQVVDESAEKFYTAAGYAREEGVLVMSRSYTL